MKIALVAPIEETIPPLRYGGTEWIVYDLAHGMGMKGHQVDLYATGDSKQEASYHLIPTIPTHLRGTDPYAGNIKMREAARLIRLSDTLKLVESKTYDIIHNHNGWRFLLFSRIFDTPVLTTHHGPLSPDYQQLVYRKYKDLSYVSISNNQRRDLPELHYVATIYNGIDEKELPFKEYPEKDYMLFLARISPEKGPVTAARAAIATQKELLVAGKVDITDQNYYEKEFKPLIENDFIHFLGELNTEKKVDMIQNAKLLLVPIEWEEPFGLMFAEAMSCGTPVVTFSRGSAPEIIVDGVTGFLVNQSEEYIRGDFIVKQTGIDGLSEAIKKIYALSGEEYKTMRRNCRAHIEKHFTVEKMIDEYEKVYNKILSNR